MEDKTGPELHTQDNNALNIKKLGIPCLPSKMIKQ